MACATVADDGAVLAWGTSPSAAPAGTGGTIVAGHYVLTSAITHLAGGIRNPPPALQEAMDIDDANIRFAYSDGAIPVRQLNYGYARSGTSLAITYASCSTVSGPPLTVQYSVSLSTLVIIDPGDPGVVNDFGAYQTKYTFTLR
jgi:hypothetical protein